MICAILLPGCLDLLSSLAQESVQDVIEDGEEIAEAIVKPLDERFLAGVSNGKADMTGVGGELQTMHGRSGGAVQRPWLERSAFSAASVKTDGAIV